LRRCKSAAEDIDARWSFVVGRCRFTEVADPVLEKALERLRALPEKDRAPGKRRRLE
jgi:hypothetical protein